MGQPGEGAITIDPEKQKREKAERQRRREEKRKEREKAKKKVTLADIIRSAGPDPAKKLKPASKKVADVEKEERERAEKDREERESKEEEQRREQEKRAIAGTKRALVGRGELCLSTTGDEIPGSSLAKKELTTREGGNMPDQERESKSLKTNDPPQQCETHGSKRDVESELPASDGILQEAKCTECKCTAERTSNSAASISETGDPGSENSKVAEEQCRININANPDFSSIVKETVERSPSTETKMVKTSPLSMNRHGKEKQIKPILVVREAGSSSISNVEETKARVSKSRLPASSAEESENISPNSGSMQAAAPINID